jgi:hypothetical protein
VNVDEVETSSKYPVAPDTAVQLAVKLVAPIEVAALAVGIDTHVVPEPDNGEVVKYAVYPQTPPL